MTVSAEAPQRDNAISGHPVGSTKLCARTQRHLGGPARDHCARLQLGSAVCRRDDDDVLRVKQVGREMGVRYVLEGSVRKAGNRVRVTAQLIETETSNHIWVERYDRDLTDVLTLRANLPSSSSRECPLRVISGHSAIPRRTSAIEGKADIGEGLIRNRDPNVRFRG